MNKFQERRAYDSNGRLEYYGEAEPGVAEGEAKWAIERCSYSGINEGSTKHPNGSNANVFIWKNRANYRYR